MRLWDVCEPASWCYVDACSIHYIPTYTHECMFRTTPLCGPSLHRVILSRGHATVEFTFHLFVACGQSPDCHPPHFYHDARNPSEQHRASMPHVAPGQSSLGLHGARGTRGQEDKGTVVQGSRGHGHQSGRTSQDAPGARRGN